MCDIVNISKANIHLEQFRILVKQEIILKLLLVLMQLKRPYLSKKKKNHCGGISYR